MGGSAARAVEARRSRLVCCSRILSTCVDSVDIYLCIDSVDISVKLF